jgi:DNA-binding transcriptional MerR regulator
VQEMKQIMDQLQNEGERLELANQIILMQEQNEELSEQIDESIRGFSLFGWLNKLIVKFQ